MAMYQSPYMMGQPYYQQMPQPMQQNMMQPMQMAQQQVNHGIIQVQGEAAAKAWIVAPGDKVPMLDIEAPYLYIKEVTMDNVPKPLRKYRLIDETEDVMQMQTQQAAIRRDELEGLMARVDRLEAAMNGKSDT